MSFLSDVLGFEKFALKDMWKSVRKDPERLFLGAIDPFSTRMWNKTGIGKDWEPVVDQFGGPYSGAAMGGGTEGVYGRAAAAGVPTEAGGQMHEIARAIASIYAGNYGAGKLNGLLGDFPGKEQVISGGQNLVGGGGNGGGGNFGGLLSQQPDMSFMARVLEEAEAKRRQREAEDQERMMRAQQLVELFRRSA